MCNVQCANHIPECRTTRSSERRDEYRNVWAWAWERAAFSANNSTVHTPPALGTCLVGGGHANHHHAAQI